MIPRLAIIVLAISAAYAIDFEKSLGHIKPKTSDYVQTDAVIALIQRALPHHYEKFVVFINQSIAVQGKDVFSLLKLRDGNILILGTSGVAAASGFNYYLKYYLKNHIAWQTSYVDVSEDLPNINITIPFNDKFRYYQNVCTAGYSFTWWTWRDWEKHIDWIAMNSFNLVLAFNGQEAIWRDVFMALGMKSEEIDDHFTGPAFLPWNRMGNVRGWGGPLRVSWHERTVRLQEKILSRMRELGIIPVLPAFAGQVPAAFKRLFPNTTLHALPRWNNFNDTYCCPYLLDPTDSLFKKVGNMIMTETIRRFGTDHVYNCDTFNEMPPISSDVDYLRAIGSSIYSAMTDVDPQAIWVMQGWLFVHEIIFWDRKRAKALLTSVPQGKMIILDLQSEQHPQYGRFDSYFGQPFIWCMLHNFGGTLSMFGSSDIINQRVFEARLMKGGTMIGTGLTPEGINQNYAIYDLMTEMSWRQEPIEDLTHWFSEYALRMYGSDDGNLQKAWHVLQKTVYNFKGLQKQRGKFTYNKSPSTRLKTWTWYSHCELLEAWDYFLEGVSTTRAYNHDVVDLTRQVLQNFADEYYDRLIAGFKAKNITQFRDSANVFLEVFDDVEKILRTDENFLLGSWINAAKACALNDEDRKLYEFNARNQITLWGPNGEIKDYANKQWSGMVSHFFQPRWTAFIRVMNESLTKGIEFKESKVAYQVFKTIEEPFSYAQNVFPDQPFGDAVAIAKEIHLKWRKRGHCRMERSRSYESEVREELLKQKDEARIILVL
ncbi:PREDICTED: alpha-N-acetylglucosaminidase isoform X2 [Nicrophorus vespilloides]|uniref:Alpha-N-acetylglucosaminidase isoform X2 n=1 Tax=Nicrophorus vespilloides TaxID=110193 RepID=A0ABM1N8Q1_NICVS|nr:PREDICTED: alpha-N-acetylglucosaminidase isoform X2 [Nicrophorus vespilloides]